MDLATKNDFQDMLRVDELVKSRKLPFSVIPAKAGIQSFQPVTENLDSGFHRSDDFLRDHHYWLFLNIGPVRLSIKYLQSKIRTKTIRPQ